MKPFKFLQNNNERVFTEYMDMMDDYFLGGITHRPTRVLNPTDMEYYNTEDYVFFDVSRIMFDPDSFIPYKFMLFRHIEEGYTIEGDRIRSDHPMWNFPDIM